MEIVIGILFIAVLTFAWLGFKYLLRRGIDKVGDSITNAVDKKRGKMEETEMSSLADRYKDN